MEPLAARRRWRGIGQRLSVRGGDGFAGAVRIVGGGDRDNHQAEEAERRERLRRELAARYFGEKEKPARPARRVARLWVVLLCVFVYGFFLDTTVSMPENAWVYASLDKGVYYAPPFLRDTGADDVRGLVLLTAGEAKRLNYRPDETAKAQGYFRQDGRSLSAGLLEKVGLLKPAKSRWNKDGTWNW